MICFPLLMCERFWEKRDWCVLNIRMHPFCCNIETLDFLLFTSACHQYKTGFPIINFLFPIVVTGRWCDYMAVLDKAGVKLSYLFELYVLAVKEFLLIRCWLHSILHWRFVKFSKHYSEWDFLVGKQSNLLGRHFRMDFTCLCTLSISGIAWCL